MATLTISNDDSSYFSYASLPRPVAVSEACCLTRSEEKLYANVMVSTADGIFDTCTLCHSNPESFTSTNAL
ncbi:hypothetical protein T09_13310 [Trichinella sp. T9]|nr:hypothetical protein T09_13310 [Trichinella sp. T9]